MWFTWQIRSMAIGYGLPREPNGWKVIMRAVWTLLNLSTLRDNIPVIRITAFYRFTCLKNTSNDLFYSILDPLTSTWKDRSILVQRHKQTTSNNKINSWQMKCSCTSLERDKWQSLKNWKPSGIVRKKRKSDILLKLFRYLVLPNDTKKCHFLNMMR